MYIFLTMRCDAIVEYISSRYARVAEIGIGYNSCVAEGLLRRGVEVIATDLRRVEVPEGVKFFVDDVMNPRIEMYRGVELIYSIRPPPELYSFIKSLAKSVGADCLIRPFGNEYSPDGRLVNYKGERFYVWMKEDFAKGPDLP